LLNFTFALQKHNFFYSIRNNLSANQLQYQSITMPRNPTQNFALDELPQHLSPPLNKNHYGSTPDGVEGEPRTYAACDLDVAKLHAETWGSKAPKFAVLSDHMVGIAIEVGVDPASLARWYPGDFVYKKGILGIRPGKKNSGHPSFCPTGEVNIALGIALTGDPIHNCKVKIFGAQILTVPTSLDEFRTINFIVRNVSQNLFTFV
jgi:hypothetical protein